MSTTTHETVTYPCSADGCEAAFEPRDAVRGSFCSAACARRHRGRKLLNIVAHDHRICHSCGRWTKEVERPPMHAPDFVIGYQYLTEHAELGPFEPPTASGNEDRPYKSPWLDEDTGADAPADRVVKTTTICECGTTDHRDDYQRTERIISIRDAAERFCRVLERLGREGQHDETVDARALVATLRQSYEADGELDWALAVGTAIDEAPRG